MSIGAVEILVLAVIVIWLWALVDSLAKPQPVWEAAGQNKVLWVVIVVVLGIIGAVAYLVVVRPQLRRAGG